jgi:serine/threonine-protein kinase
VTDPAARQAFASQAAALTGTNTGPGGTGGASRSTTGTGRGMPPGAAPVSATHPGPATNTGSAAIGPPSAAMLEAAQRLLAQHLGPIAKVVVRKAGADAPQRDVFIGRLLAVVDDPAVRRRLQDDLNRLPP